MKRRSREKRVYRTTDGRFIPRADDKAMPKDRTQTDTVRAAWPKRR